MGMRVRDSDDEFKGADFRDEASKLLFAYDYTAKYCARVWGHNVKTSIYKEARRLGVPRQSLIKIWIAERLEDI